MGQIFPIDKEEIISKVRAESATWTEPQPSTSPSPLQVATVRTYTSPGKNLDSRLWSKVAVPPFALHWGVVVEETIYHLTFVGRPRKEGQTDLRGFMAKGHPIQFTVTVVDSVVEGGCPVIGTTKYTHLQRLQIGRSLIKAFGSYHQLFWNCQIFSEIYLEILTEGEKFPE